MEGFLTRGWEIVLSGYGGPSALARGATLAARWLHLPQPISNHLVRLGFAHPAGRYRPDEICDFVPGLLELWRYGRFSWMGAYPVRVRRDLGVGPRDNSRRALAT